MCIYFMIFYRNIQKIFEYLFTVTDFTELITVKYFKWNKIDTWYMSVIILYRTYRKMHLMAIAILPGYTKMWLCLIMDELIMFTLL